MTPVPLTIVLKIERGVSLNTFMAGIFIDRLIGDPPNALTALLEKRHTPLPLMGGVPYDPPPAPVFDSLSAAMRPVVDLWNDLDPRHGERQVLAQGRELRLLLYRLAAAKHAPAELLRRWRWELRLWTQGDREEFT